jgi:septum site-determining protein MinC
VEYLIKDNTVIFKGGKNGIIILLDEEATFEQICRALRRKVSEASKFFADTQTSITFKGKELSESQILALLDIMNDETDMSVTFVEDLTGQLQVAAAIQMQVPKPPPAQQIIAAETYFHKGSLRSGQSLMHTGSVVIMGDVNAGAEVLATGNVMVFGTVRGLVHAGSGGDEKAFICAISIQPNQFLSIAGKKVHYTKEMLAAAAGKSKIDPEYVYIQSGLIHIDSVANIK